jgi:hypothetical protein
MPIRNDKYQVKWITSNKKAKMDDVTGEWHGTRGGRAIPAVKRPAGERSGYAVAAVVR